MGLSDRHFISQPLEQRIITIWNKIKFSDFRNNQKQILKQENFPGKSPLRWSSLWERRSKRPHTLCWLKKFPKRGPGMKPPSTSNLTWIMDTLLNLYYHEQIHLRGDFHEKFPCFNICFWSFLKSENLVSFQNEIIFCPSGWLMKCLLDRPMFV